MSFRVLEDGEVHQTEGSGSCKKNGLFCLGKPWGNCSPTTKRKKPSEKATLATKGHKEDGKKISDGQGSGGGAGRGETGEQEGVPGQ